MPHIDLPDGIDIPDVSIVESGVHLSVTDILLILAFLFIMYLVFRMSP